MCSFTRGDITGVLENLGYVIAKCLGRGETVTLDGIGTFFCIRRIKKGGRRSGFDYRKQH